MSSLLQLEANRRNSQKSTGPRTPEGQAVSRFNALKSGINSKAQVIPGEDPAELEAMTAGYHHDWAPNSYLERFLVDSLIRADWLLQRLSRLEAEMWAYEIERVNKSMFSKLNENAPLGEIYSYISDRFTRLQRRIDSTERSYYRALAQLQRLRAGGPVGPHFPPAEPAAPSDPLPEVPTQAQDPAPSAPPDPAAAPPLAAVRLASFCHSPSFAAPRRPPQLPVPPPSRRQASLAASPQSLPRLRRCTL